MAQLTYQLDVDLPDPWRTLSFDVAEEVAASTSGPSLVSMLPTILEMPPGPPDYMASLVLPLTPGPVDDFVALLVLSMVVKVVAAEGEHAAGEVNSHVIPDVPVSEAVSAPVLTQTIPVPADDRHAVALVTISTPNVLLREELEPTFPVLASMVSLRRVRPPSPVNAGSTDQLGHRL